MKSTHRKFVLKTPLTRLIAALLMAQTLVACWNSDGSSSNSAQACFAGKGKAQVLQIMEQWYLWNDEADQFNKYRDINLDYYEDVDALLHSLRYRPAQFDRGFSYVTTPEEEAAFFGEGEFVGFGFGLVGIGNQIYISQIFPNSPAATANMQRGDRLLAIDGRDIRTFSSASFSEALGPPDVGFTAEFTVENTLGTVFSASLSKAVVTIDPVPVVSVMGDTGYILFNTFITSAADQLREAFADFGTAGVNHVIIDLRYNGGGLVSVSEVLASLLRGPGHESDLFSSMVFNSARTPMFDEEETTTYFGTEANALTLDKIVFITSRGSASASELVINGLAPYFGAGQFALVGAPTYGKPVGQFAFDFCDEDFRLRAVTFKSVNVEGNGDYFDGLPVDCAADDDVFEPLGSLDEASLAEALAYISTGNCAVSAAPGFTINRAKPRAQPLSGPGLAQQYAGAF